MASVYTMHFNPQQMHLMVHVTQGGPLQHGFNFTGSQIVHIYYFIYISLSLFSLTIGKRIEESVDGGDVVNDPALLHAAHKLLLIEVLSRKLKLLDVVVRLHRRLLVLRHHLPDGR